MAEVDRVSSNKEGDIFSVVFPKGTIRPPKQWARFERKANLSIETIKDQLSKDSRGILGVIVDQNDYVVTRFTNYQPYFPLHSGSPTKSSPHRVDKAAFLAEITKTRSWRTMPSWQADFGTTRLDKVFAGIVDRLISDFITWSYAGSHANAVTDHLLFWVENLLCPYTSSMLSRIHGKGGEVPNTLHQHHLSRWKDMAITRLADQRVAELFDIIVDWDTTASAIDDLKQFTTNIATRSYLTADFSATLSRRLLQPGASTIEILQIYIFVIKAFRRLDTKGVLLERVARKMRRYLRERDDTIKIVVAGLLADISETTTRSDPSVLSELAVELQQRDHNAGHHTDGELDWNNMDWVPDPIDAAPEYMKSKNTDVIGSLISLFESKDIFVKELQIALADRLLENKTDYDQEIGVVEHLKIRFGDSALQGCEVMLRDVLDSRKVDQVIRQDQNMDHTNPTDGTANPEVHAKILSRLFWPSLQEQTFHVPEPVQRQQAKYENGFQSLKQSRKLTWLNAIGQVEVLLELEDRTFQEEVLPWQASVIYAFQDNPTHSITSLQAQLAMTPALTRSACMFWAAKRILAEVAGKKDTFTVLERLPVGTAATNTDGAMIEQATDAAAAQAAELAAAQAARDADEVERKQKMAIYHQFVVSMLTNQGAMPLPRIAMMLGIVVPGGFPFSNEELREFLSSMVKDRVLEIGAGGAYKIAT